MSVLSVLGGLILLLLGICGVGLCASSCGDRRPQAPVSAPVAIPEAARLAFPERLGDWTRRGELGATADGFLQCEYQRNGESCRLFANFTGRRRILWAFGKDMPDATPPLGWRFFREVPGGGFVAGYGEAWKMDNGDWSAQGPAVRVDLSTTSRESAENLLREIPLYRLDAALQVF